MVDMEKMISNLMLWTKVTEEDLKREKIIKTDFGEDLSWEYLCYVREHPLNWTVPTEIRDCEILSVNSAGCGKKF